MTPVVVVLTIGLLLSMQPVSTDLYLPALPTLQRDFGASTAAAQQTLSALILCFGLGQLVCGPLADRFGRRPVLLAGMALYSVASLAGAFSASIETLILWRGLQGAGLATAITCGRAVVRDVFQPHEGARALARALGGLGIVATSVPVLGGVLVQTLGWRAVLAVPALIGAAVFSFIALRFDETLTAPNPHALRPADLWRNGRTVLAHPTFRAWTALVCCSWGGIFFLLAASSFVFINVLGTSRIAYGAILAVCSFAYIGGTVLCRYLLLRHGLRGAVQRGALFSLAGGVIMAGLSVAGVQTIWAIVLPQLLFGIGHGVHQPCAQAGLVGPFPDKAGTAASMSGFLMMLTAFLIGLWLGRAPIVTALPLTLGIGACSVMLALVAWTLVRRHGDVHAPVAVGPAAA